jgi:hypothetical protein
MMRPILARAWTILAYSVPTSFLLLFGASHATYGGYLPKSGQGAPGSAVIVGNTEAFALMSLVALLVLLSMGSALQYWLEPRRTELFSLFLVGVSVSQGAIRLLSVVAAINAAGFCAAAVAYWVMHATVWPRLFPGPSALSVAGSFAVGSVLVVGGAAFGIIAVCRDPVRMRVNR